MGKLSNHNTKLSGKLPGSALTYVLLGLIPYTNPNLKLAFRPHQFFNDLEQISRLSRRTLQAAYYRGRSRGLITSPDEKNISLSLPARRIVQPFIAKRLSNGGQLMVIFDIPEDFAGKRTQLRRLLRELGFHQIQLSVWMSDMDHTDLLRDTIRELYLDNWVQIYEAARIE